MGARGDGAGDPRALSSRTAARRTDLRGRGAPERSIPDAVLQIAERVVSEGDERGGEVGGDLGPEDARRCSRPGCDCVDLDRAGRGR